MLAKLWKTKVSSKGLVFGWRLFLNRSPSRMDLARRRIIVCTHNLVCPMCFSVEEDVEQLFLTCHVSMLVRKEVC